MLWRKNGADDPVSNRFRMKSPKRPKRFSSINPKTFFSNLPSLPMNAKILLVAAVIPAILASCGKPQQTVRPQISFTIAESGSVSGFERTVATVR
jgi:hypothetical protein